MHGRRGIIQVMRTFFPCEMSASAVQADGLRLRLCTGYGRTIVYGRHPHTAIGHHSTTHVSTQRRLASPPTAIHSEIWQNIAVPSALLDEMRPAYGLRQKSVGPPIATTTTTAQNLICQGGSNVSLPYARRLHIQARFVRRINSRMPPI